MRAGPVRRLVAGLALAVVGLVAIAPAGPHGTTSALSTWTGGIDLYRPGVFTTQKSWLWCTAADLQIIRNIVDRQADHSTTNQSRYFAYMRARNRYPIPVSDGVDPAGWTAGMRHYIDSRYRLFQHGSFDRALRDAVTNLRKTNLPVAVAVQHGNHGWVLTGFTATADPAATSKFTVTSVRVTGPLWGLQSRSYGYDMKPDTKLTVSQFKSFWTAWHYAKIDMAYEGKWISIQGVAVASTAPPVAPSASAGPSLTPAPSQTRSASPSASPVASAVPPSGQTVVASASTAAAPATTTSDTGSSTALLVAALAVVAIVGGMALRARRGPQRRG